MSLASGAGSQARAADAGSLLSVWERITGAWGIVCAKATAGASKTAAPEAGIDEQDSAPAIWWTDGAIHVRDRRLIDASRPEAACAFVRQAFRLEEVRCLELDWGRGLASVHYEASRREAKEVLERLAAVTRGKPVSDMVPEVEQRAARLGAGRRVRWFRHGRRLSTWQVASETPGRIRFRSTALAGDHEVAHRVELELGAVHGVRHVHARPLTASLLVEFDPDAVSKRHLVHILDDFLENPVEREHPEVHPPAVSFGIANVSVGLAAIGELAVPALLPASALLLVVSNARVIREAGRELRHRQLGLPLLYTVIVAGTLGTGQFLGATVMSWMYKFWRHRHRLDQGRIRRQLLPSLAQRRRFARLSAGGEVIEIPTDQLRAGDRITVDEGELVPADGRLVDGPVVVDERLVGGVAGLTRKWEGDPILAGSWSVQGSLEVEVAGIGRATRAARLGRELAAATVSMPTATAVTARGETFARGAVVPTLAAAGAALVVGDLSTASAILRPDYATGPGLGASLELLQDVAVCAREGVFIRDASAFERLFSADVWIFDQHPALECSGLEVACIEGDDENSLLRLAATAFKHLGDPRGVALREACESRGISLLPLEAIYRGATIELGDGAACIIVRDVQETGLATHDSPLEVLCDGQSQGRVGFCPSSGTRSAAAIGELRRQGALAIGLISDRSDRASGVLAAELGMDFHAGNLSSTAKAELVRSCRARGLKVAFVGDCRREPGAAREAYVSISLGADPEGDPGHILAPAWDLGWLPALRELSRSHLRRVRSVHSAIMIPNLFAIAGAFFLGFTSLSVVVITNVGTWAIYSGLLPSRSKSREFGPGNGQK